MSEESSSLTDGERIRVAARTRRFDLWRSGFTGVSEFVVIPIGILLANRYFLAEESPFLKAGIPAAHSLGLLMIPLFLPLLARIPVRVTGLLLILSIPVSLSFLAAMMSSSLVFFVSMICLVQVVQAQHIALRLQYYTDNYPAGERGKMMSSALVVNSVGGVLAVVLVGWLLDRNLDLWRWVFVGYALSALAAGVLISRIPSRRLPTHLVQNPLKLIPLLWQDRAYGWMLFSWMLMGLGNLLMIPLRVEYASNPLYGLTLSNQQVMWIALIIPLLTMMVSTRVWGMVFDRLPFVTVRTIINPLFMVGNLIFFMTGTFWWMIFSSVLIGLSMAGANISWNLWVTKYAPPDRTTEYMSLHGFTTGIRGLIAPFMAFYLVGFLAPAMVCWVGSVLIFFSIVVLMPSIRNRFGA